MKAILAHQFGGPEVLKLEDVEKPSAGPGQVLVQVKAAGINPVDSYILTGTYARKPQLPYTPGMDGAGIVSAVGPNVKNFKIGDRVYVEDAATGTFAEFCLVNQDHAHLLPASLSFSQGAALGVPYATAHFALLTRAKVQKGEILLIHGGSGGVGVASIQLAKVFGLKIIATAGTDIGLQLVKDLGADYTLNHKEPNYLAKLMEITQNKGVDVILEMAAHINLGADLTVLANNGRVVIIGSRGPVEINPRDILSRGAIITGMSYLKTTTEENTLIHASLANYLTDGKIKPIIGKEIPLKDAARALQDVMAPGAHGKIVLIP
jgi:NADPH2:quinone reductase